MTLVNWREGQTKKPRTWQDVIRLARALHLRYSETDNLLRAAGYPPISQLYTQTQDTPEQLLLSFWTTEKTQAVEKVPFQAIHHAATFVGQEALLQKVEKSLLIDHHDSVTILEGMAGAGKTALAAYVAHRLRTHFPDGVLWARLDISSTMSILHLFAIAYEVDVASFDDLESRSAVVRMLLANKHVLLVLDNVSSSQEIRPLLPSAGPCAVLITTRRRDLSLAPSMRRFQVEPFNVEREEALALFSQVLGENIVARERILLLEIAELLGHLPLAIGIAAWRLAYEPDWTVADFLTSLHQEKNRLDMLVSDTASIQVVLETSYALLSSAQQQFFAALGTFGGEDFGVEASAFVAGMEIAEAKIHLRSLFCLSLVCRGRPERYRLVPLLRTFARKKITENDIWKRLVTYFITYAEQHQKDIKALDIEKNNILAAMEVARERNLLSELSQGLTAFSYFVERRGLSKTDRILSLIASLR